MFLGLGRSQTSQALYDYALSPQSLHFRPYKPYIHSTTFTPPSTLEPHMPQTANPVTLTPTHPNPKTLSPYPSIPLGAALAIEAGTRRVAALLLGHEFQGLLCFRNPPSSLHEGLLLLLYTLLLSAALFLVGARSYKGGVHLCLYGLSGRGDWGRLRVCRLLSGLSRC